MYNATRNDVKQLAEQIESLAKQVQTKLASGDDFITTANELVRNNMTFVFALGEVYALEQTNLFKKTKKNSNYHNLRDSYGRFIKKI